jgi:hypothetical protein
MPKQATKPKRTVPTDAELSSHTKQKSVTPPPGAVWISAQQVLDRYGGRSEMWLVRKLKMEADFPRPMYSGRLRFFRLDEIEQYEKQAVVRGQSTQHRWMGP